MVTPIETSKLNTVSPTPLTRNCDPQVALELVAEYLRAGGVRDPNRLAALANECVHEASLSEDEAPLVERAVKLASIRLGLPCAPSWVSTAEAEVTSAAQVLRPNDVVPPTTPRVMPEQKLDELLAIAEPEAWRKIMRAGPAGIGFLLAKVGLV